MLSHIRPASRGGTSKFSPSSRDLSRRRFLGAAGAATTASVLAGCAQDADDGRPVVTVWGGFESMNADLIAHFNATQDVRIRWVDNGWNLGQYYQKFMTTMHAGTGAPDVFMTDLSLVPHFVVQDYVLDLGPYGAAEDAEDYDPSVWTQLSEDEQVFAIPVDAGPLTFFHQADRLEEAGIDVPTDWDSFAAAADRVRTADDDAYLAVAGPSSWFAALIAQAGGTFFSYDLTDPTSLGITVDTEPANRVMEFWGQLLDNDLVDSTPMFTTEMDARLIRGGYWGLVSASWYSWQIESKATSTAGAWRVAGIPQWDSGTPRSGNWGGSGYAVSRTTEHPEAAAHVARTLFGGDPTAWDMALWTARLFPTRLGPRDSAEFRERPADFYGGQAVNDVYVDSSRAATIPDYSPFDRYFTDIFDQMIFQAMHGELGWSDVMAATRDRMVSYAREQAFDVY
ncbi:ABC transporter substrate-binding protein [Ruania alba]|uniref:Multiple sugar transport system substrate-binding protein n=1 Tax=Ruania alba TaxID=648782 RepID=A0A1H5GTE2_9MICO|nr:extracellular solute-binding protein [Ruania alba]SEE18865.1 multiple sugar transport system substrate-binding protein [Ruania alba]